MKKALFHLAVILAPSKKLRERELKVVIGILGRSFLGCRVAIITCWYAPKVSQIKSSAQQPINTLFNSRKSGKEKIIKKEKKKEIQLNFHKEKANDCHIAYKCHPGGLG